MSIPYLDLFPTVSASWSILQTCKLCIAISPFLTYIFYISHFKNNTISGTIPSAWASMQSIQGMYFSNNNLSGPFPTVITQMKTIQSM